MPVFSHSLAPFRILMEEAQAVGPTLPIDAIAVTRPDPGIARPIPSSKGPVIAIPATAAQAKAPQPSRRLVSDDAHVRRTRYSC